MFTMSNRNLYQFPDFYTEVNRFRKNDIIYYRKFCKSFKGRILEVGCGSGRVTWELAKDGKECWGCDPSPAMINYSKKLRTKCLIEPRFICSDINKLNLNVIFRIVIIPFNVIMHCYSIEELINFFYSIKNYLIVGGFLVFDLIRPNAEVGVNYYERLLPLEDTGGIPIKTSCKWIIGKRLARFHWEAYWHGKILDLRVHQYFFTSGEIRKALNTAGFTEIFEYGNYNKESPTPDSPLILMEVKKSY